MIGFVLTKIGRVGFSSDLAKPVTAPVAMLEIDPASNLIVGFYERHL
jgi:hypothetical protein